MMFGGKIANTIRAQRMAMVSAWSEPVEPGLLGMLRCFVGVQAVLVIAWVSPMSQRFFDTSLPYVWIHAIVPSIVWLYLAGSTLERRLARGYLPMALGFSVIGQVVAYSVVLGLRLDAGVGPKVMLTDSWLLIPALLIPFIFTAWQYGHLPTYGLAALAFVLELVLNMRLTVWGGPRPETVFAIAFVRLACFVPAGYMVARLVGMLRAERAALKSAHARLKEYVNTLDALATSRERNRIARELHDILAHGLSALAIQLEAIATVWATQPDRARVLLAEASNTARNGMREARRAVAALRATPLEALGFVPALRALIENTATRAGLSLQMDVDESAQPNDPEAEQAIYRIVEEACANVVRHAQATRLSVRLQSSPLRLTVADDGRGFDPSRVVSGQHFGLDGMRERARLSGATLSVTSGVGQGTSLNLGFPAS